MTCQHCQTWILDDDHRCRRCGRRVRATPSRISPASYPIAASASGPISATATARAYDFAASSEAIGEEVSGEAAVTATGQQTLFTAPVNDARVISFDSLTTAAEREAIRSRAAEVQRPSPVRNSRVEIRRPRGKRGASAEQRRLEFQGQEEGLIQTHSQMICDAPVAPAALRVQAATIDGVLILAGCVLGGVLFAYAGGHLSSDKHSLPFLLGAIVTVPFFYKLLWAFAGRDSFGTQKAGLQIVDFDGNPPSKIRRYQRMFGGILSLLAAGIGLIWALVDEDCLTWHDHISSTFPTFSSEA